MLACSSLNHKCAFTPGSHLTTWSHLVVVFWEAVEISARGPTSSIEATECGCLMVIALPCFQSHSIGSSLWKLSYPGHHVSLPWWAIPSQLREPSSILPSLNITAMRKLAAAPFTIVSTLSLRPLCALSGDHNCMSQGLLCWHQKFQLCICWWPPYNRTAVLSGLLGCIVRRLWKCRTIGQGLDALTVACFSKLCPMKAC